MSGCFPYDIDPLLYKACYCDCHNGLIQNPKCYCTCRFKTAWKSSTNPPGETLSLCKHGRPVKFGCTQCYGESYNEEKKEMIPLDILPILKRIEELERKQKFMMDKLEEEFRNLEQKYDHCQDGIDKCFERIEHSKQLEEITCEFETNLLGSIKELERRMDAFSQHITRQIDENRKASMRLDMFESMVTSEEQVNVEQNDKITEIENSIGDGKNDRGNVTTRLEWLENFEESIVKAPHPRLLDERLKKLESDRSIGGEKGRLYLCEKCKVPLFECLIKDILLHNTFNVICHSCFNKIKHDV